MLRRALFVRLIQQVLDAQEDLLHGDGRPPVFVDDGQADGARRIHVRMEERGIKRACGQ